MQYQGKIVNWNDDKGYGFVEPTNGGNRAFVHIKAFAKSGRRPVDGDCIEYKLIKQRDGRYKAEHIMFMGSGGHVFKSLSLFGGGQKIAMFVTVSFWGVLTVATMLGQFPLPVLIFYVVASVVTFIAYAVDKSAAQKNRWRTKENTLHILALVGGWTGALYAQHKSSKPEFKVAYWVTVVANILVTFFFGQDIGETLVAFLAEYGVI